MPEHGDVEIPQTDVEAPVVNLSDAVRQVLKYANYRDGVVKGLHEVTKAIEARRAKVCFLASNCSEAAYKKLVQALCKEQNVPLIEVEDNKELGKMAGLCRIDRDGNARKVIGASSVAVTEFGDETQGIAFLQSHTGFPLA